MQSNETFSDFIQTDKLIYQLCDEIWNKLAKYWFSQIMTPNFDVSRDAGAFQI